MQTSYNLFGIWNKCEKYLLSLGKYPRMKWLISVLKQYALYLAAKGVPLNASNEICDWKKKKKIYEKILDFFNFVKTPTT